MYTLTYDDLHFEWKDEALAKHGNIRDKRLWQEKCGATWSDKYIMHSTIITKSIWETIKKFGFPKDCTTEKDKKIYLLNLMDTKLLYKEIIDFTINYLNENIKY